MSLRAKTYSWAGVFLATLGAVVVVAVLPLRSDEPAPPAVAPQILPRDPAEVSAIEMELMLNMRCARTARA